MSAQWEWGLVVKDVKPGAHCVSRAKRDVGEVPLPSGIRARLMETGPSVWWAPMQHYLNAGFYGGVENLGGDPEGCVIVRAFAPQLHLTEREARAAAEALYARTKRMLSVR